MVTAEAPPWPLPALLRALLDERLLTEEELEHRLGWREGGVDDLLAGERVLGFAELLQVLAILELQPAELLARLYGLPPGELGVAMPPPDPSFEESRTALREAMRRRSTRGRSGEGGS
jgi:hypothetical protein